MGGHIAFILLQVFLLSTAAFSAVIKEGSYSETQSSSSSSSSSLTSFSDVEESEHLFRKFENVKSDSSSSSSKEQLIQTFKELKVDYFNKIVQNEDYFNYFSSITGYKGEHTAQALYEYLFAIGSHKQTVKQVSLAMKHVCEHYKSNKELPKAVKRNWTGFAIKNFANFKSEKDRSTFIASRLEKLLKVQTGEESSYLDRVLQEEQYAKYIAKATGFTGNYQERTSLKSYVAQTIQKQPRLVAVCMKQVTKHQSDSSYQLKISKLAEQKYGIGSTTSTTIVKKEEHKKVDKTVEVAFNKFGNRKSNEGKSVEVKSELKELLTTQTSTEKVEFLDKVLETKEYAKHFAKTTGYVGDYKKTEELKTHIKQVAEEHPKLVASAVKKVSQKEQDFSSKLKVSTFAQEKLQTIKQSTTTETSSVSQTSSQSKVSGGSTHVVQKNAGSSVHVQQKQASSSRTVVETRAKEVLSSFQNCGSDSEEETKKKTYYQSLLKLKKENKEWLLKTLEKEVYFNYIKQSLGIEKSRKISTTELLDIWSTNFFKEETSQYSSVLLKNIFLHMTNKKTVLEPTKYMVKYQGKSSYKEAVETIHKSVTTTSSTRESSSSTISKSSSAGSTFIQNGKVCHCE
ncbi:uncharacterized protein LOC142332163 [Lycorma delicatula]|uniref:uncharacterized protein LOC142332163 n=1 Tax=Lycorma delicatula TaxID=130591 RepID=UPI003F50E46C